MFRSVVRAATGRGPRLGLLGASTAVAATMAAAPAAAAPPTAAPANPGAALGAGRGATVQAMTRDLNISDAKARQRLHSQDIKTDLANRLTRTLDSGSAGTFIDHDSGRLVINVTSAKAADRVRSTTARPRVVPRSMHRLASVQETLQRTAVTGATLTIDVRDNTVDVTVPDSGPDGRTRQFVQRARSFGDAVQVTRVDGAPRTSAFYGGDAITGGDNRCSAGFVAEGYVITAGHCTEAISSWDTGGGYLGPSVDASFPGNDYGLIRIDGSVGAVGAVRDGGGTTDITNAGTPPVGAYVCKTGSTTGTTCGSILGYNATVNYPSGTVSSLIKTDVCTQSGDSGAPLFDGSTAVGVVSGGTNKGCESSSFRAFFQPVQEALDAYGLNLS